MGWVCNECHSYQKHPDFGNEMTGRDYHIVEDRLDRNGKPLFCEDGRASNSSCGVLKSVLSAYSFESWLQHFCRVHV